MLRPSSISLALWMTPLVVALGSCTNDPTGLVIAVRSDGWVRTLELTGGLEDGREAFPRTTATLPNGESRGTLVLLLDDALAGRRADLKLRGFSQDLASDHVVEVTTSLVRGALTDVEVVFPPAVACGNGVLDPDEGCDDANAASDDGCSAECQVEIGWSCSGKTCAPTCGDARIVGAEACDDGNIRSGDGCSQVCSIEPGWACQGAGCVELCSDGRVVGAETCDDQNLVDEDGCDESCRVELGWDCTSGLCEQVCTGASAAACTALNSVFGAGMHNVRWGMSPTEVRNAIGLRGEEYWNRMPIPGEYAATSNVRYLYYSNLREVDVYDEQDPRLEGGVVFFFQGAALFRVSIRFWNSMPDEKQHVLSFASRHDLPVKVETSGPHFSVKTSDILLFGAHNAASGCFNQGPCLELIKAGSPIWDGQRFQ